MNFIPEIIETEGVHKRCKCNPRCDQYFRINGMDVYCKKKLEQLAINILNTVNGTTISQKSYNNRGWTTKMEKELIQFIETNGVRFGTYRILAELFGKSRAQVKRKVYKLEEEGRLRRPS
ncbi:hypothetical protein [Lysinibacillus odysseyi]|uniref:Uncharacterized protein n=1 Tax=Lysinibacillus odysseyi 34hs-1 = NBRC 100172 TaxID=1220589 RepID=A0A0A3IZ54_9BACI|nr:hypothetical protein [Lysinibacillus odysseyi]KGR88710.1 hypothetical protein CD32_01195 [Lysinibacillus odysseyi 34hs-1 = NBRC 100172]